MDFVLQLARELALHSEFPLYSLIRLHKGLDLADAIQYNESSLAIRDTDSDSDVNETDLEDMLNASDSNSKIQDEFVPEEEELLELDRGVITWEHRLRIPQQNTIIWNMSRFILITCVVDVLSSVKEIDSNKYCKVSRGNFGLNV